jgi:hypothetical protein
MLKKPLTILWIITGLAVVLLLVITLNLRSRATTQEAAGFTGTITGVNSAVYLYQQPSAGSHIITVLDLGATVYVSDSDSAGESEWYYVNTGEATGWLPASRVSRDPP